MRAGLNQKRPAVGRRLAGVGLSGLLLLAPIGSVAAAGLPSRDATQAGSTALLEKARSELAAGRRVPALASCMQVLSRWPDDEPARRLQVRILTELGASARAWRLAQVLSPAQGIAARGSLDADVAAHELRWSRATPADPRQPYAAVDQSIARMDRIIDAADGKQPALAARVRIDRLIAYDQADRTAQAVRDYRQFQVAKHPLPAYARPAVADALLQQRHPREAAVLYERIERDFPGPYGAGEEDPRVGLMYAYLESGRIAEAIAVADRRASSLSPWQRRHGVTVPVRDPAKLQADLDAALVREYSDLLGEAQQRLYPMLQQAPMNAQLWREYGNLQRARGWPRAAERSQSIALGIEPNDVPTQLAMLDNWRQLNDFSRVQPTLVQIEQIYGRNPQVQRERRSWDRQRGWQFDVEHDRGRGNTPNLGDSDHQTEATLASPLLNDHWRVQGRLSQASANLPEGYTERDRLGLGLLGYLRGVQLYARALAGVGARTSGTALEAGVSWSPTDHWTFGGDWNHAGDADVPMRAHYYGITANALHASVSWRASELTEAGFGASQTRFSDGNHNESWQAHVLQRLFTAPQLALDGGVQLGSSRNSESDVPYYSPSRARWAALDLRLQNLLFQRYDEVWRQRVDVQAGSYDERGFGSGWIASARYGQSIEPRAGLAFGWGLSWSSQPYDGRRDTRVALDLTMHWGE